ncbi:DUF3748 domain-containing protein [Sphingobacterium sp. DN00404]|uniref:DUF3748 domain-containing protein n=1 Tax=Sphingobacterium micropteri TaxID=2763501 RepID=A0ABR7YQ16_9SPHI|nr:DUF3748 domain-containing protein [Sphingobacterium micropteri]MBD1433402.1 DUF3748 domain-containing protein [Sphingobacterium micropteri]
MDIKNKVAENETVVNMTVSQKGHTLHHNGVFSPDGKWIVFDGRNDDTKIGETATIGMVNVETGEERIVYQTTNQTMYGPGVGAASFSPVRDRIVFIHGLPNADQEKPYDITRRTGVAVDLEKPMTPVFLDARDIAVPYTPGSLRGGTHSHCWSGDGNMLSFTYNDEMVDPQLRVVGVMVPHEKKIDVDVVVGNNHGEMYAAIVSDVVAEPILGTDQINKAFDECWIGRKGYLTSEGQHVPYAIAFQGNVLDEHGVTVTEIFIVDIDIEKITADTSAVGKVGERPKVPQGIRQRRLTYGADLSDRRHWLRSSHDGKYIYALAKDEKGNNQIVRCDVNTGELSFVTNNPFSITSPFNLCKESNKITFVAENNVFVYDMDRDENLRLTRNDLNDTRVIGIPSFSPDGEFVVYNQYERVGSEEYLQIKRAMISDKTSVLKP